MSKLLQKAAASRALTSDTGESKTKVKLGADLRPVSASTKVQSNSSKGKKSLPAQASSNVIYLGHIPNGFYEQEMRQFFTQFGVVQRLKLFRSRRTGNSKGYGFIEFADPEVAKVVAESMQGYFLMERVLVSHVVPLEKVHKKLFCANPVPSQQADSDSAEDDADTIKEDELFTENSFRKMAGKQKNLMQKKQKKLLSMGIDFTIPFGAVEKPKIEVSETAVKASKPRKSPAEAKRAAAEAIAKANKKETVESIPPAIPPVNAAPTKKASKTAKAVTPAAVEVEALTEVPTTKSKVSASSIKSSTKDVPPVPKKVPAAKAAEPPAPPAATTVPSPRRTRSKRTAAATATEPEPEPVKAKRSKK